MPEVSHTEMHTYVYDFIIDDELVCWKPKPEHYVRIHVVGSDEITWKTWIGTGRKWVYKNGVWFKNIKGVDKIVDTPELEIFYQKNIRGLKLKRIIQG